MRLTMTALALSLATAPAFAGGDVPAPPPAPVIVPVVESDWTGAYVGGQVDLLVTADTFGGAGLFLASYTGAMYGVFGGYRYDLGDIVIGGEVDYMMGTWDVDEVGPGVLLTGPTVDVTLLRIGAEVGYDLGDALVYGTAGYANISMEFAFPPENEGDGFFYGVGVDYRLSESITIGAEIIQHEFNDFNVPAFEADFLTAGINIAFTF